MSLADYPQGNMLGTGTAIGGYTGVRHLQGQLQVIAASKGKPNINPGTYDGTMTLGTIVALANAASVVGASINEYVGKALDVVNLIKKPLGKIPYADTVLDFVLTPWIVDEAFAAIVGIIGLIPGGGGAATAIRNAVDSLKATLANASEGVAIALMAYTRVPLDKSGALGVNNAVIKSVLATSIATTANTSEVNPPTGYTWVDTTSGVPGHWEHVRPGQTPNPGPSGAYIEVRDHTAGAPSGGTITVPPVPGRAGIIWDNSDWMPGRAIVASQWSQARMYYGYCPQSALSANDFAVWKFVAYPPVSPPVQVAGIAVGTLPPALANIVANRTLGVRQGVIAFKHFQGFDGSWMGAFWNEQNQSLKICKAPKPSSSSSIWDIGSDIVSTIADSVESVAQDVWNFVSDEAVEVYEAAKKYGCALVNNDIVVGIAAAGVGIVASPAASASVVAGATAGKAACVVIAVSELLYAIIQLLSMDVPSGPPDGSVAVTDVRVVIPDKVPVTAAAKYKYPTGTIAWFDEKFHYYRIAIPVGTTLGGLGTDATHIEIEPSMTAPPTPPVSIVSEAVGQKATGTLPWYKNPWLWTGVGIAVVGGTGTIIVYRRRHK